MTHISTSFTHTTSPTFLLHLAAEHLHIFLYLEPCPTTRGEKLTLKNLDWDTRQLKCEAIQPLLSFSFFFLSYHILSVRHT